MARRSVLTSLVVLTFVFFALSAWTQTPQPQTPQTPAPAASPAFYAIPIGAPISVEDARKAVAAAMAEAQKNHWFMAAAVVDPDGELV